MNFIDRKLLSAKLKVTNAVSNFIRKEDGDTNFISMLLIIGIVVVLAGLFLTLAKDTVLQGISDKIKDFMGTI